MPPVTRSAAICGPPRPNTVASVASVVATPRAPATPQLSRARPARPAHLALAATPPARPPPRPRSVASPASPRAKPARVRWFLMGLGSGAILAIAARGEGPSTLHDLREWSAHTLRALEHHPEPPPQSVASPSAAALASVIPKGARPPAGEAPCGVGPGPQDPCAERLAPFPVKGRAAPELPTVAVESLPRARPAAPPRRPHPRAAPLAPTAVPDADEQDDAREAPPDLHRAGPGPARPDDDLPARTRPLVAPEQTAANYPR